MCILICAQDEKLLLFLFINNLKKCINQQISVVSVSSTVCFLKIHQKGFRGESSPDIIKILYCQIIQVKILITYRSITENMLELISR